MAEVSIGIEEMADLVRDLESAREQAPGDASSIRGNLDGVWLSTEPVDRLSYGSAIWGWLDGSIMDVHRRLALARLIAQSSPGAGLTTVTFDDAVLSRLTQSQVDALADTAAGLINGVDPLEDMTADVDAELLDLLAEHAHDPYFAQALAERVSPQQLDTYLRLVNAYREMELRGDEDEVRAFDERYNAVLNGLGLTFGLASQGTGETAVPGLTSRWTSYIEESAGHHTGAAVRLSLVIGRGQWSSDFLVDVYTTIRDAEGDRGAEAWTPLPMDGVVDPDLQLSPGGYWAEDPLAGVFRAMASNPDAVFRIFGSGDRESVEVDGRDFGAVNSELFRLIRHRGMDEHTVEHLLGALQGGISSAPEAGGQAWQPVLAEDLQRLGEALDEEARIAEEQRGPWWSQLGHGLLDVVGMVPLLGEAADGVNGLWYLAEGNELDAGLSFAGMLPVAGWFSVGGKWVRRAFSADELVDLQRLADSGDLFRHLPNGRLADDLSELADPDNFRPSSFLTAGEMQRFADRDWLQRIIAGNRFDGYMVGRYDYDQVQLATGRSGYFRLDSYSPGEAIVSRKLTQFNDIQPGTARGYIDEFVTKYPEGATIADTPLNRQRGLAGRELEGRMVLEVPPQTDLRIPEDVAEYAFENGVRIIDVNGFDYTAHLFDDVP